MSTARIERAEAALARSQSLGLHAWWRRGPFQDPEYRDQNPRWHRLASIEEAPLGGLLITAACGYRHIFTPIMGEYPRTRTTQAPRVADRCRYCHERRP